MSQWTTDPNPHLVADGVARFRDPADADRPLAPSMALIHEPSTREPLPSGFRTRPDFGRTEENAPRRVVRLTLPAAASLYGAGEAAGPLLRNGRKIVCWNTDTFEYDDTKPSLYQSHPWVLAVRADGTSFGILADTTCRCEIDLGSPPDQNGDSTTAVTFTVDAAAPPFAVYIFERDAPRQVVGALADLTGRMPLPPKWALGYHQSRWSYEPADRVLKLADEFRARQIPCDCIWLDIDYMDGFRCFTFDKTKFPDPAAMNSELHAKGFKTVWMIDAGIKVDPEYPVYAAGNAGGHFLQNAAGGEYHGKVWPGTCAFPDFTREPTRQWWAGLYRDFLATGMDGVWNDMNEPAVFDNEAKQMPEDNHHRADEALGGPGPHARYHNAYGMLMVRATREGIAATRPDKRPFVLTRSNFIGGQRYAATWTGDNKSDWDHLAWSIPMALNMGLSGQPFVGPDIGGFSGNADAKLFARWMGIGALLPFARAHSIKDSVDHEPWSFGPECENTCRLALNRRYRLMPYLYTLFREASLTDVPIVCPVFFADARDPRLRDIDDCFLIGPEVLVRACTEETLTRSESPMPPGVWRRYEPCPRDDGSSDPELPELFIRAGAIVPLGPVVQSIDDCPTDPLTLVVSPDHTFAATGRLYEDAGDGMAYQDGHFRLCTYRARREADHLIVERTDVQGRLHEHERYKHDRAIEIVVLLDGDQVRTGAGRDGDRIAIRL